MLKMRRVWTWAALGGAFTLAVLLAFTTPAEGQKGKRPFRPQPFPIDKEKSPPPKDPASRATHYSAIKLVENTDVQRWLDSARTYIAGKDYNKAFAFLQVILDGNENLKSDFYVQVKRFDPVSGEQKVRWASAKYEANALLGSMGNNGLEAYEVRFGDKARKLLTDARARGDDEMLADVAQRYMHTRAGTEANELLATAFLDRGQFFTAALRFERLLNLGEPRYKTNDLTLFKVVLAYRRAGDTKNADRVWKQLEPRLVRAGGLHVGDKLITTARVRKALDQIPRPTLTNPHDWPLVWGDLTRSAQAKGSPPLLDEILWSRKTVQDKNDEDGTVEPGAEAKLAIDNAVKATRGLPTTIPIMPGAFPIAAAGRVVVRTPKGITATFVHAYRDSDGKVVAKPGEVDWKSTDFEGSLVTLLSDLKMRGTANNWLTGVYVPSGFSNLIYENSAVGVLSTDHKLVYAIDDLAIPCPPRYLAQHVWNTAQVDEKIKPLVKGNSLQAFELETGKIAFKLGGNEPNKTDQFNESHFLGVPLAVGGKLYILNERSDGKLRLFTLEVRTETRDGTVKYLPTVIPPIQELGTVDEAHRVVQDIARRASTVHLAYGEGVLVCPTNAGEILGVDLTSRTLAWAYPYRQTPPAQGSLIQQGDPRFGNFGPPNLPMALTYTNWKVTPPVIAEGKVVFTAPDSVALHCISLRDGTPVWSVPRQDSDVFFAGVFDGKAVVVGKNSVRAYRLDNGDPVWAVPTGDLPAGQGVAAKNVYYLPLQKGEIIAIDVARGQVKAHNRPSATVPGAGKSLGNLVFYEGAVLSQTVDEIVAYPQLTAKLDLASKELAKDPDNLEKRVAHGELLLRDGQLQGAVDDLRTVWLKKPEGNLGKRVRQQLYEAFTDLLQADFATGSKKYLEEYRALCEVPGEPKEQEFRQARFLRIVGQGKEAAGDLVAAFKAYREFGRLPLYRNEGVPSLEDPGQKIPSNVWLKGRVTDMLAKAKPEQRQTLEEQIAQEWKAVQARGDVEAIRSFVGMFDVPFQVGRAARLQLADTIIAKKDAAAYLEAELDLLQLRGGPELRSDPQVGGRALDALARLEIARGKEESMRLAVSYYRELAREFPNAAVHNGKTGSQLFKKLSGSKIFWPYLGEPESPWGKGKIEARELPGGKLTEAVQGFLFHPSGELAPPLRHCRLVIDTLNSQTPSVRVLDMSTNTLRGDPIALGKVPGNGVFYSNLYRQAMTNVPYHPNARFRFFQGKGHLAVLQIGLVAYGLDLSSNKLLWQHKVLEKNEQQLSQFTVMPDDEGNIWLVSPNRGFGQPPPTRTRVGSVGAVQASYVALTTNKGLVVLDPLRGTVLWTKAGVSPQTEVFGDDQYVYLVETSSTGVTGPTRVLRAADGNSVKARDFTHLYRHRLWARGGKLLAADPAAGNVVLRLYDIVEGKDVWKQGFAAQSVALRSEDPNLTGAIEPNGKITVVDLRTQKVVFEDSVLQGQVTPEDVKNLQKPLLLADSKRFYVALNTPIDSGKVGGGVLVNNFANGLRCAPVTGWFCSFARKGGDFWHLEGRTDAQMIVLEQFAELPVLLFSVRYTKHHMAPGGGIIRVEMVCDTASADKESGKVILWPTQPRTSNGNPQFSAFSIDPKAGTINMIGYAGAVTVQHYIADGRKRPEDAAALQPGGQPGVGVKPAGGFAPPPPGFKLPGPGGFRAPPRMPIRQRNPLRGGIGAAPQLRLEVVPAERPRVALPARR